MQEGPLLHSHVLFNIVTPPLCDAGLTGQHSPHRESRVDLARTWPGLTDEPFSVINFTTMPAVSDCAHTAHRLRQIRHFVLAPPLKGEGVHSDTTPGFNKRK